ncbi:MAG: exodeoxyribonuclease III [Parvularculaceae bacterium]
MKVATYNVNSVNARLPRVLEWLDAAAPDVVALQEIKCVDEKFPGEPFEERGFNVIVHGQKSYNGVALLSKHPTSDVRKGLPGDDSDDQARYVEAVIEPDDAAPLRVCGLYLPNGNPAPGPKFDYKLKWMNRLRRRTEKLLSSEEAFVLAGDFNVIPQAEDVHDPVAWAEDALYRPETKEAFREIAHLGLTDAVRQRHPSDILYTFWDYQRGAWEKDHGIRIDHLMMSPQLTDRLEDAGVDRATRAEEKASDHVPVWATFG